MRKTLAIVALAALVLGTSVVLAGPATADHVGYCIQDSSGNWDCSRCYSADIPKVETNCVFIYS